MRYDVEAFREDTDKLTESLLTVVREHVGRMAYIDRAIIVAAALANVACTVDAIEPSEYRLECSGRLYNIAASWEQRLS